MGWMTGIQLLAGAGIFFPCHHIQTSFGAHPASYPMGTGGFYPRGKALRA